MEEEQRRRRRGGQGAVTKKGPWSPWEDQLLMEYVSKHGEGSWKEVAQRSGLLRCGKSCRLRWANQLRPHLRRDRFTPEEEATILLLHSIHGNKWAKISAQLPGRTDNSIKNFMNTRAKRQRRQGTASNNPSSKSAQYELQSSLSTSRASFSTSYSNTAMGTLPQPQDPINHIYASTSPWSWAGSSASTSGAKVRSVNFPQLCATARAATATPTALPNGGAAAGISCDTPSSLLSCDPIAVGSEFPAELPPLLWFSQEYPHGGCTLTNDQPECLHSRSSDACAHDYADPSKLPELGPPSVQPSVQFSSSRSYSDPLAVLGGESVSLFKDYRHNFNMSFHSSVDPCASSSTLANLLTTPSCTLESTINYSDSDYTLERIIRPLAAWSRKPGVPLGQHDPCHHK